MKVGACRAISFDMRVLFCLPLVFAAGCVPQGKPLEPVPSAAVANVPPPPPATARSVEDFDTTTVEQRAAAITPSAGGVLLGIVVVSLGDATQPGFWVETPLVEAVRPGRVNYQGNSVEVELRPGVSHRASLAALRLLEAPLADLSEVEIYAR